jgi:hypothetical protein
MHTLNLEPNHQAELLDMLEEEQLTKVNAQWFSGSNRDMMHQKLLEYKHQTNPVFSESLFPNPGILEIDGPKVIALKTLDPRQLDLSSFKARLVANDQPFQITSERLHVDDEYCAVSYQFDAGYAEQQVKHSGGLFLEFHQFSQTITPLRRDSNGFVTLAKWDETQTQLEMVAIQIPYGYTLIIQDGCIHGDTNLNGLFMMCMTSDHLSMQTADTVFLKHATDKDNITIILDNALEHDNRQAPPGRLAPFVFYKQNKSESFEIFKQKTQQMEFIFTPFNLAYYEVKQEAIYTAAFFVAGGACLFAAITLANTMLMLSLGLFIASGLLAGVGFFRLLSSPAHEEDNVLLNNAVTL